MELVYNEAEMVNNRPHYPITIMSNCDRDLFVPLKNKIGNIWPHASECILYSAYSFNDDGVCKMLDGNDCALNVSSFRDLLDSIKRNDNIFDEMSLWNFYNIIDTEKMDTLEEFIKSYNVGNDFKYIAVDRVRTMAIILLDDSLSKRELSKKIRKYIYEVSHESSESQNTSCRYDGNVVLANRDISDVTYEKDTLVNLVANVILISNNDAASSYDDENFRNIVLRLYSNSINTVSCAVEHRPNRDIALQIYGVIITELKKILAKDEINNINWQKRLGIYAGKISYIDEVLKSKMINIDLSALDYLPFKSADCESFKVADMNYRRFIEQSWENSLNDFIQNSLFADNDTTLITRECVSEFEKFIINNFSAIELSCLSLKEIDELFAELQCSETSQMSTVGEYVKSLFIYYLQKELILPEAKNRIIQLQERSTGLKQVFTEFCNEYYLSLPANGVEYLGELYKNMTLSYLSTDTAKFHIKRILSPVSTFELIAEEVSAMCNEVVDSNRNVFSLSLVREWEKRLDSAGENVYIILNSKINNQLDRHVFLNGNFPTSDEMTVYMFRTHKCINGINKETDLFNYFKNELYDISKAQFLNTGSDDLIEVIRFVNLPNQNILL